MKYDNKSAPRWPVDKRYEMELEESTMSDWLQVAEVCQPRVAL